MPNGKKKTFYFGPLTDPDAAPERFNREWPFLKQGRTPPPVDTGDGCRLLKLCKAFLTAKNAQLDGGELSGRTFGGYHQTAQRMLVHFGRERLVDDLRPDDFEDFPKALSKSLGLAALRNEINRVRIILKYAFDNRLIDRPVAYGQGFDKPSARMLRKAKHEAGANLFEADEVRRILDATDPVVRAMTYLAINTGCGNTDIAGRTGIGPPYGGVPSRRRPGTTRFNRRRPKRFAIRTDPIHRSAAIDGWAQSPVPIISGDRRREVPARGPHRFCRHYLSVWLV